MPGGREVATDTGRVRVPDRAVRVACADFYGAFAVVDLGLVPGSTPRTRCSAG